MFRTLLVVLIFMSGLLFNFQAYAITPEEYCAIHDSSDAPGTCTEKGDCAVITTNLGTEECKICGEGGCELTDCSNCKE